MNNNSIKVNDLVSIRGFETKVAYDSYLEEFHNKTREQSEMIVSNMIDPSTARVMIWCGDLVDFGTQAKIFLQTNMTGRGFKKGERDQHGTGNRHSWQKIIDELRSQEGLSELRYIVILKNEDN